MIDFKRNVNIVDKTLFVIDTETNNEVMVDMDDLAMLHDIYRTLVDMERMENGECRNYELNQIVENRPELCYEIAKRIRREVEAYDYDYEEDHFDDNFEGIAPEVIEEWSDK